jgi:transposase
MSLQIKPIGPMPSDTHALGEQLLAPTDTYRIIGQQLSDFVSDNDFADLYSAEGAPALSPALLAMVTVFQHMENLSDRLAASMVVTRLDWKYALRLALTDTGFNYSVLSEFRTRLVTRAAEARVFEQLLRKLKVLGLVKGRGVQRTDALAVIGAVSRLNRLELVCETLRKVLVAITQVEPAWLQRVVPPTVLEQYGERAESERLVKARGEQGEAEVRHLARQAGQAGQWLLERIDDADTPHSIKALAAVATLRTVWQQQFAVTPLDASAQPTRDPTRSERITFRAETAASGAETITTPHDPQARYSEKHGVGWQGYKVHVTETVEADRPHVITDIRTTAATLPDEQVVTTIQQTLASRDVLPAQQIVDMGYMSGKALVESEAQGIELMGPVRPDTSRQARSAAGVALSQFEIDLEHKLARCPQGHTAVVWSEGTQRGQAVVRIRFPAQVCAACPLYAQCVMRQKRKPVGRTLKVGLFYTRVKRRRHEQTTVAFKQVYRRRSGIEATLSAMVRTQGLRRSRYIGIHKTNLQHQFIGAARNLKRCARWLAGDRAKPRGRRTVGLLVHATHTLQPVM